MTDKEYVNLSEKSLMYRLSQAVNPMNAKEMKVAERRLRRRDYRSVGFEEHVSSNSITRGVSRKYR